MFLPDSIKRYIVLVAAIAMLVCLGISHAWSVYVGPLKAAFGLRAEQTQLIWGTQVFTFCTAMFFAGRLHDKIGPRPMAIASGLILIACYLIAWKLGSNFYWLWLSMGFLSGLGTTVGYVCPIATAVKWFPNSRGLVCGLAAAGFACGAIVMSLLAEVLYKAGWGVLSVYGLISMTLCPGVLVTGLLLATPPAAAHEHWSNFRRRHLLGDRRFWMLFVGMVVGTLPYLIVMGVAKPMGLAMGVGVEAAMFAITMVAIGNAAGRILWGYLLDKVGQRRAILGSQMILVASVLMLLFYGNIPLMFMLSVAGIGFCFGSCFAIFPAIVARLYGAHVLGSVYPLVMLAQAFSSLGPMATGAMFDRYQSYTPGLALAAVASVIGLAACAFLSRPAPQVSAISEAAD